MSLLCLIYIRVLQSYDPTTHFETTVKDVLAMYTRITGKVGPNRIPNKYQTDRKIYLFGCHEA